MEELREMNRRGDVVPTPPDAPEYDLDAETWALLETAAADRRAGIARLSVQPETLAYFYRTEADPLGQMAKILDEYAAGSPRTARRR